MTATDVLRRMLDERGVEYRIDDAKTVMATKWDYGEHSSAMFTEYDDGECVFVTSGHTWTPEQAIAATLGQAVRHPKPHEKWTTVLLPEIAWGWDDSWPDYLSVAHDTNGEWRTYVPEATLGATDARPTQAESSGTCRITDNGPWGYPYVCSACGASFDPDVNNGEFNYCPNCGRKVVTNG